MVRIATFLLFAAPVVTAFTPSTNLRIWRLAAAPEYSDDFDAPVLANPQTASPLDHEINVEGDECYLGKYGQHDECVDFDPIHSAHSKASNKKAAIEMPDFTKLGDDIMGALKKSPIGKLFVQN